MNKTVGTVAHIHTNSPIDFKYSRVAMVGVETDFQDTYKGFITHIASKPYVDNKGCQAINICFKCHLC